MAVHDPKAMARLRVYITTPGGRHGTYFHFLPAAVPADAVTTARNIVTAIRPLICNNCTFDGADWIAAGTNVSNPATWGANISGTSPSAAVAAWDPYYLCLAGRTTQGTRTRLFFYGAAAPTDNNWRYEEAEFATITALLGALVAGPSAIVALDGSSPVWKHYLTVGANRHFQRKRHAQGG